MEDNDSVIFSDKWSTIADVSSLNLNYRRASGISPCTLTGIRAAALIPRYSLIQRIGNGDKNRSYAKKESPKHARKISGKEKSEMKNNIARL